ncbi:MAG: NAD(P)(+) transhydrogenase (Re/Si-specific) subunit beta [Bifidobacteriaceae bacterium]|jgi:NAD(P) transhydrogenase subunit beta|nr:NAD(P)(+) transhydrogenase (Re/Si-specific) subunit beta [Bifidobacteriaceae bacterium]
MSATQLITWIVYLVAAVCFVMGLHLMRSPGTARRGNLLSAAGMGAAVLITVVLLLDSRSGVGWHGGVFAGIALVGGLAVGGGYGWYSAKTVKMTAMPQLVSVFNAVGGGAAAFVALTDFLHRMSLAGDISGAFGVDALLPVEFSVPVVLDIVIGSVTFTGSWIAAGKLQGIVSGNPITFAGSRIVMGASALLAVVAGVWTIAVGGNTWLLLACLVGALTFGVLLVLPIGGADMPVVISLLNAFTGLAVAMAGFVVDNEILIVAGALVGASGSILTKQMADAMNRSILSIMVGGFGQGDTSAAAAAVAASGASLRTVDADDVAIQLAYASKVMFVPGYGLAAGQAQHEIAELGDLLSAHGVTVYYAVHPVAGRMPGHMNVLLAEASVPYDEMKEMEEANPEFDTADVALVVGANDVTNPAARRAGTPISGMPILDVDHAKSVVVIKRGMGQGYAGIDNELYTDPKTGMFFSDAKKGLASLIGAVKEYLD